MTLSEKELNAAGILAEMCNKCDLSCKRDNSLCPFLDVRYSSFMFTKTVVPPCKIGRVHRKAWKSLMRAAHRYHTYEDKGVAEC